MLAHLQGSVLNAARIASSLGVSGKTVMSYLDLMVDLLLVRKLEPYHTNTGKRLIKSPKVYVRDSGLLHALLDIGGKESLLGHPVAGMSWEGFVMENILNCMDVNRNRAYFYKTSSHNEIDLIIEKGSGETWCVEIKRSRAPALTKGYQLARQDIKASGNFIVYPGSERFPLDGETEAIGLMGLIEEIRQ